MKCTQKSIGDCFCFHHQRSTRCVTRLHTVLKPKYTLRAQCPGPCAKWLRNGGYDILVNEKTQQFSLKESLLGYQLTTHRRSMLSSRHPPDRTRTYVPQEVVQQKFNLREVQKTSAVQQAFNGPLTADTGKIHSGRIWLGWLLYPIRKLPLTESAGLHMKHKLRTVQILTTRKHFVQTSEGRPWP
jgi:hypothetical protein